MKTCCKCGEKSVNTYCNTCRWLLRIGKYETPSRDTIVELGLTPSFEVRQAMERIPSHIRPELWPEVDYRAPKPFVDMLQQAG